MGYKTIKYGKQASRRNYSRMRYDIPLPNLIKIQTDSFNKFVEKDLGDLLKNISPIEGHNGDLKLHFEGYHFENPRYSIAEAKKRDVTYIRQLVARVKLENSVTGEIKEGNIIMLDLPFMTPTATFVVNGAERVIVSQIVRSSGVYFTDNVVKKVADVQFSGQMIPTRGAWVEFELGNKGLFYAKLDRSKKIYLSTFIKILGLDNNKETFALFNEKLLSETYDKDLTKTSDDAILELYSKMKQGEVVPISAAREFLRLRLFDRRRYDLASVGRYKFNKKLDLFARIENAYTIKDIKLPSGEIIPEGSHIVGDVLEKLKENRTIFAKEVVSADKSLQNEPDEEVLVYFDDNDPLKIKSRVDIVNQKTGEVLVEKDELVTDETIKLLRKNRSGLDQVVINYFLTGDIFTKGSQREGAVIEYLEVKVIDPDTKNEQKVKVVGNNQKETKEYITVSDMIAGISYFINLHEGLGEVDDIDHLGNRRVRLIGELMQNQFRVGLARTEKSIKDKMSTTLFSEITISSIINMRPLAGAINAFFGSSQLSQFMDQTNPLAELTQKRRISALGTGGLSRDRAGIEVRDVHNSHYGRICPIETPEGQSIGLISSLASYSQIDEYGFIQTPYLKVDRSNYKDGAVNPVVIENYEYLTADEEYKQVIASAASELNEDGTFVSDKVIGRYKGETGIFDRSEITYMDVSPKQIVSVATSTIPFLEHDDPTRCLMGANMQRQAVPLIKTESPIVGTGIEYRAAKDSGAAIVAKEGGYVVFVDATKIEIAQIPTDKVMYDGEVLFEPGKEYTFENALKIYKLGYSQSNIYDLTTFERSNQDTCILQRPIVQYGEWVDAGDVICDGPSTNKGELALGKNVTIAFMTWEGYNYEDAVIMCEDLVKKDVYTSVHIDEYQIETRDLKNNNGKEELTRQVPNARQKSKNKLDERGIIIPGIEVEEGDILVGKITPKGGSEPSPTERLIQEIIGEKAKEYRDSSLKVPHGGGGIVQKIQTFSKKNGDILPDGVNERIKVFVAKKRKIREGDKMAGRHGNKGVISKILPREDMPYMEDGTTVDIMLNPLGVPSRMNIGQVLEIHLGQAAKHLNVKIATPVFDGVKDKDLLDIMKEANVSETGKTTLYDGRTGIPFKSKISVGVMYMIKLSHMVEDKLHTRNVGPYTLVTQQPMGGKAQNGGQRFGEMEVWALYAYGAAYTLQEMLTVKSDDKIGRNKLYSSIVNGRPIPKPNLPESFRVLTHELQALGLYVELLNNETGENDAIKSLVDNKPRVREGDR